MSDKEAIFYKARCREMKKSLLDCRKLLKISFRSVDNALKSMQDLDLEETFDEVVEMKAAANIEPRIEPVQHEPESEAMPIINPKATLTPVKEDGHICELPRCKLHQPFRATVREAAKLTEAERLMWSREPAHTPPGYWNLEI